MLFQRYMTGRGNLGYGFRAQTNQVPNAPYNKLRAADTGDSKQLLLEIMTTSYHELAAIGSYYDREQANGYTDILLPVPEGGEAWEKLLDNPGRLLYLPHISKAEFLEISNKGKTVSLGMGEQMTLPAVSHKWDGRFQIDDDTMADLIADVWYAASLRMSAPQQPGTWRSVNIRLTDDSEKELTADIGREFYCNVLMPALPRALRSIVSVSIGGRFDDMADPSNGGAAAVLMTLPEQQTELKEGTYVIMPGQVRHRSIDPFNDEESWHNFGRAVLAYAKGHTADPTTVEGYLTDFFAVSELILSKEAYAAFQRFTASWPYAYLLYNAHQNAEAARLQKGEYAAEANRDEMQSAFSENVWDSADPSFLEETGISETETRNGYVALEQHMLKALLANRRIRITPERYEKLVRRAFALDQIKSDSQRADLAKLYDELLLLGTEENGNNALLLLLELTGQESFRGLFGMQRAKLRRLLKQAWQVCDQELDADHKLFMVQYAQWGREESVDVTDFAVEMVEKGSNYSELQLFRAVQTGQKLDDAVLRNAEKNAACCMEDGFCQICRNYAEEKASEEALTTEQLKSRFAEIFKEYICKNASAYRKELRRVVTTFTAIGMEESSDAMETLLTCIENGGREFADEDVAYVVTVLESGKAGYPEQMLSVLCHLFDDAIQDRRRKELPLVEGCWVECVRRAPESLKGRLKDGLVEVLAENVTSDLSETTLAMTTLGLDSSKDEVFMKALCGCMENGNGDFSAEDARNILPVLQSDTPEALRMKEAVLKAFAENVPELMERVDDPETQPWKQCIRDRKLSEAQNQLAQGMKDVLYHYIEENTDLLAEYLSRVMEMTEAYGCTDAARMLHIFSKLLVSRAQKQDDEAALTEQDLRVIRNFDLKNVGEEECATLVEALHTLFIKELPHMDNEEARKHWSDCINGKDNRNLGEKLRGRTAETVCAYVLSNRSELCYELPDVMALYTTFGGNSEQRMNGWCSLLCAVAENDTGVPVLRSEYVEQLDKSMLRSADEACIDKIVQVFRLDLEYMLQGQAIDEWTQLNAKMPSGSWKTKAQEAMIGFVAACQQEIGEENSEDSLERLLQIVCNMGWTNARPMRKAIAEYLMALKRNELSEAELQSLMNLRSNGSREIDAGLNDVFSRVVLRLLKSNGDKGDEEARLWGKLDEQEEKVNLYDGFSRAYQQAKAEASKKNKAIEEKFILSLLRLGTMIPSLRTMAAENAICVVEERKNLKQGGHAALTVSAEEHQLIVQTIRDSASQSLLLHYAKALDYVPVDAENAENEKMLQKRMREIRASLLDGLDAETAIDIAKVSPVWQQEIQQAVIDRMKRLIQDGHLSFQELCDLSSYWTQNCQDWPFAEFSGLARFIQNRSVMEEAIGTGAAQIIAQAELKELKAELEHESDDWYTQLLKQMVMQRISRDAADLAVECKTPQEMQELLNILEQSANTNVTDALKLILAGDGQENVLQTQKRLAGMSDEVRQASLRLMRKVVFGNEHDQWKKQWNISDCTSRIPLAALCYLSDEQKAWAEFFQEVLQDSMLDKKAMNTGADPVQALMFASSVLCDMGLQEAAAEMPEQLKLHQRSIYTYVRAIGRRHKEMAVLKKPDAWKATGAADSMYRLVFGKH